MTFCPKFPTLVLLLERRCVAAAVISVSVVSAACLWCVSDSLRCTFWINL